MFQKFRHEQSNLTTINLDELRRQVGIAILITFAFTTFIINLILIINELSLGNAGQPTYNPFAISIVSLIAAFMSYRRIYIKFALHFPLIMLIAIFISAPSLVTFVSLSFTILIYTAIISHYSIYAALSIVVIGWSLIQQQAVPDFQFFTIGIVACILSGIVLYVVSNFEFATRSSARTNQLLPVN